MSCIVWHQSRKGGWFGGQSSNTFEPYVFWHSCRLLTTLSFVPLLSRFCCHCSCTVAHTPWRLTTSRSWPLNVAVVATSRATRRPCEHARVAQLGGSCGQQCADPVGLLCSGYRDSVGVSMHIFSWIRVLSTVLVARPEVSVNSRPLAPLNLMKQCRCSPLTRVFACKTCAPTTDSRRNAVVDLAAQTCSC